MIILLKKWSDQKEIVTEIIKIFEFASNKPEKLLKNLKLYQISDFSIVNLFVEICLDF